RRRRRTDAPRGVGRTAGTRPARWGLENMGGGPIGPDAVCEGDRACGPVDARADMVTWVERQERTRRLRAAVHGKDGNAVVQILRTAGDSPPWQLAGDGVPVALAQKADGARQLAADAAAALRERGWIGDAELADQ